VNDLGQFAVFVPQVIVIHLDRLKDRRGGSCVVYAVSKGVFLVSDVIVRERMLVMNVKKARVNKGEVEKV